MGIGELPRSWYNLCMDHHWTRRHWSAPPIVMPNWAGWADVPAVIGPDHRMVCYGEFWSECDPHEAFVSSGHSGRRHSPTVMSEIPGWVLPWLLPPMRSTVELVRGGHTGLSAAKAQGIVQPAAHVRLTRARHYSDVLVARREAGLLVEPQAVYDYIVSLGRAHVDVMTAIYVRPQSSLVARQCGLVQGTTYKVVDAAMRQLADDTAIEARAWRHVWEHRAIYRNVCDPRG